MKALLTFKSRLLAVLVALACCASVTAQDYTALKMGEVFTVKDQGDDIWTITPEASGLMKIVGDNGDGDWIGSCLVVYDSPEMKKEVHSYNFQYYEVKVQAGHTYYIKNWNMTGQDYKAHCAMGEAFTFKGSTPSNGSKLAITSNSTAHLKFTTNQVTFTEGEITANGNVIKVYNFTDYNELVANGTFTYTQVGASGVVNWNGNICGRSENGIIIDFTTATGYDYYNVIYKLCEDGKLKAGDNINLNLHGVRSMMTNEMLNGTGELEVNWVFAGEPTVLVEANVPETILSWYNPGDPAGIATFTFSRDIKSAIAMLEMGQGEGAEDIYFETIEADHVTYEGNTVKIDLSGVMRTKKTMELKMNWNEFRLQLLNVIDIEGNSTYSKDQGSASSYTFTTGYKDISKTLSYDITPASGSTLTAASKQIEIWINDPELIVYDGVDFTYYENGEYKSVFVPRAELSEDADASGVTITCPLPEGLYKAGNICVRLNITQSIDGQAHDVVAYYNTSLSYGLDIASAADPVNESTVNRLHEIYLPLGFVYSINPKVTNPVSVSSKTNLMFSCGGKIVADGMTNAKIVLDTPITDEGQYTVSVAAGVIGDYPYGESKFTSGTTHEAFNLHYSVTGKYAGKDVITDPADGETVSSLSQFVITFFNYPAVAPSWDSEKIAYVKDADDKMYSGSFAESNGSADYVVFTLNEPITAEGTYTLVIPGGSVVNAANGDAITTTYEFTYTVEPTVAPARPVVDPAEGTLDEIGNILIDFGQPVTLVEACEENGWWVSQPTLLSADGGWTLFAGGTLMPTEDPNVVIWMQDGTSVKACDAVFSIPAGCVKFADGTTNEEYTYNYTITGANAVELNIVATTPELWSYVDELSEMTITFDQPVTIGEWASATANDAFWTQQAYGSIVATDDPSTIKIVFPEAISNFGETSISIAAYSLYVNGKAYDQDIYLNITIGEGNGGGGGGNNNDPAEDENIELTPAPYSEVASLKYFEITFGGYLGAWNEEPITLTDQFDNIVATVGAYGMSGMNAEGVSFWELGRGTNTYSITLPETVSTSGFYYLNIPAVCEKPDGNTVNREFTYMFTVVENQPDAIKSVKPAANGEAYTLTGIKAKAITKPGLYIVNGKKVMIRK